MHPDDMRPISNERFEALAGYTRIPEAILVAQEFAWFESPDGRVLGVTTWDRIDFDFGWLVLGRDERGRFRAIDVDTSLSSASDACTVVKQAMVSALEGPEEFFHQGDVEGGALDFFTPVVPEERLHPSFRELIASPRFAPARELISSLMPFYEDMDGNFVEQFQTVAFDARLWEIYLFATFTEAGYAHAKEQIPDLRLNGIYGELGIEATTVNPSQEGGVPLPETEEDLARYWQEYMPIRIHRTLQKKLKKANAYWEAEHMVNVPFLLAVQDFHALGTMRMIVPAATEYLFGYRHSIKDGKGRIDKIGRHKFGTLSAPSGFFDLPKSENISAVIVNPQGTLSKFNRLGYIAGFGPRDIRMIKRGVKRNEANRAAPAPTRFVQDVSDPEFKEKWVEGMVVFHNPKAKIPLDPDLIPGSNHEFLQADGSIKSLIPEFHPMFSNTIFVEPDQDDQV